MPVNTNFDWTERYAAKVTTAAAAVRSIPRGRRILIASGAAEPVSLVEALVSHGQHLADNEIVHLLTLGPAPYTEAGLQRRFRHTAFFIGANVRSAVHEDSDLDDEHRRVSPVRPDREQRARSRRLPRDAALSAARALVDAGAARV